MAVRLVLLAAAALNERRRARTEALRFGLWVGFVTAAEPLYDPAGARIRA